MATVPATPSPARRFLPLIAGAVGIGIVFLALGNFNVDDGEDGSAGAFFATAAVTLIAAAVLWRVVLEPRVAGAGTGRASTPGLVVAVIALLLSVFYWAGLPWAFAPVAIALGTIGRERGEGGAALAALILGWIALVALIALAIADQA